MGMDVYGKAATGEAGTYFRASIWGWRPLADFIEWACNVTGNLDLYEQCEHWHSNDGDGLDAEGATRLAGIIDKLSEWPGGDLVLRHNDVPVLTVAPRIGTDLVREYIRVRNEQIADLPPEQCELCHGSGIRADGRFPDQETRVIPADASEYAPEYVYDLIALRSRLEKIEGRREDCLAINIWLMRPDVKRVVEQFRLMPTPSDAELEQPLPTSEEILAMMPEFKPHPRAGQTGWCNGCDGRGYRKNPESMYRLDWATVTEWRDFLRDCGGFEIH